jgi:hypothetical protein
MPAILKRILKRDAPDHHAVFRDFAERLERLIRGR